MPPQRKMTSGRQQQVLVEYMALPEHKDLARSTPSFVRSKEGRYQREEMWNEIACILNAEEGAKRTSREWSRAWVDLKQRVKKNIMFNREQAKNGLKGFIKISPMEQRVAGIMGLINSMDDDDEINLGMKKQSTLMQLHLLAKFMNDNLRVALGRSSKKSEERFANAQYYQQITKVLNKEGPPRTPKQWSRIWTDMKCRVRSKLEKLSANEDDPSINLTQLDELVAVIISRNPDDQSDDNGNDSESSRKRDMEEQNYSTRKKSKRIEKENENDSDDDYFPENSHTNSTLPKLHDLNSLTNTTLHDLNKTNPLKSNQDQTQNITCTECNNNQNIEDETDRNKSFLTLLSSEIRQMPSCAKSDAFVSILSYVNSIKNKHKVNVNGPSICSTFDVLLDNNSDPLS